MKVYEDIVQGTPEWFEVRAGIQTASCMPDVLAEGRGSSPSKMRQTYMYKLAGERLTGEPMVSFSNKHMERGHEQEPEARNLYAFENDSPVTLVGFMKDELLGASPDGLVGDDGLVEIKTKLPHLQIAVLDNDRVPPEHMLQMQTQLLVSARDWVDFVSYCRGLPLFVKRVFRDEKTIAEIRIGAREFEDELSALVERIGAMK